MICDTINSKNDISLINDLFTNFKETNLKLQVQVKQLNLIKSILSAFVANVFLYKQNLGTGECSQFPNLLKLNKIFFKNTF